MTQTAPAPSSTLAVRALFLVAVAFSVFQVWTAAYSPLPSLVVRSIHVGFLLLMTFAMTSQQRPQGSPLRVLDWALGLLAFGLGLYHWWFEADIIFRAGEPSTIDVTVGTLEVLLVFEAARRMTGIALPLICATFLAYALFGQHLPSPLNHRGYDFEQVIDQMFLGTEGIFGIPTYVSSTYLFLFILFGSYLEQAGMIRLFTDFALGTVGHQRGGPAKVAVISSALMGTINGSGVANVVTTGQFTIPLMKRFGYRADFAGAVEATASMGGQIMPPVMGAVAFIMAETLGVPYVEIVKAATLPAILYFAAAFWMVHLEAGRAGLFGMSKADCPDAWKAVKEGAHLLLPLAGLVFLLFSGYTPLFAGTVSLVLTVVLILANTAAGAISAIAIRVGFWVIVAGLCSAFFKFGITAVFLVIAGLVVIVWFVKGGRDTLRLAVDGLATGARNAVGVGIACALVGTIIGVMTLTGLASSFTQTIISVAGGSLFASLILTMIACLILGMGIPTIPSYIICSSLVGPAMAGMGVPLIVSHMFVFYFGIMADLTPPVALAAFAASAIARASAMKIGLQCMRIAIAGWVVPFMAVYDPALLAQGTSYGDMVYMMFKAMCAVVLWGAAAIGYFSGPVSWPLRALATAAAFMLVVATWWSDVVGFGLGAAFIAVELTRHGRAGAAA